MDLLTFLQPIICISIAAVMFIVIFIIVCYLITKYNDK